MAAFRMLFLVMFVALAAGPRAEVVLGDLGTTVTGLVEVTGNVVCPANATIGIGTSHPASTGSLVQLTCNKPLLGSNTSITAKTNSSGGFRIVLSVTSTTTVSEILRDCSIVVIDPLSLVCNIISQTEGVLESALTFAGKTVDKTLGEVTHFVANLFVLVFINVNL